MKTRQQLFAEAFSELKKIYLFAYPNSGFRAQLELLQKANYNVEQALKNAHKEGGSRETKEIEVIRNDVAKELQKSNNSKVSSGVKFRFRCRECLQELGNESDVHRKDEIDLMGSSGSLFIKQCEWMDPMLVPSEVSGKLYCPKCNEKLGSFNWSGLKDGIDWYVPGFQIHMSKIDILYDALGNNIVVHYPKLLLQQNDRLFEYVVFDCDGVLVNTEVASCESLYLCIRDVTRFEIPRQFPHDFYEVFGMDVLNCLKHYKQKYNQDWDCEGIIDQALEAKEKHYQALTEKEILPFDGVVQLLENLQGQREFIGVASSGHPIKLNRNLEMSGLSKFFEPQTVVSAVEVKEGKPAPDVYLKAFERLGVRNPSHVLVIEDSINGIKAAKTAGAFSVGIINSLPRELLEKHCDLVIDHISEIAHLIKKKKEYYST